MIAARRVKLTKEGAKDAALDLVRKNGWKPGSAVSLHSAVELMAAFGLMVDAGEAQCDWPNCGCCADAACGDAVTLMDAAPEIAALPQDVINLVIAAREVMDTGYESQSEVAALDKALEAFSSRVPYENEPDAVAPQGHIAELSSPSLSAEKSSFTLEWIAAPRPPLHPQPMRGRRTFPSIVDAINFMGRQAKDAQFVSLTENVTTSIDRSDEARAAITCQEVP